MIDLLFIVDSIVPSTEISARPLNWLAAAGLLEWKLARVSGVTPVQIQKADVVMFHRNCLPPGLPLLHAVRTSGKPIIYEIDDSYEDLKAHPTLGPFYGNPGVRATVAEMLQNADVIKAGSLTLKSRLPFEGKSVVLDYAVDTAIFRNIRQTPHPEIVVGFAGSPGHEDDLNIITPAISQLIHEFGSMIRFEFIGSFPGALNQSKQIIRIPFINGYENFLRELYRRNWDIGMAPLKDTPWNRCKTDNKFREYGACGICGVFSSIPPYSLLVGHHHNGALVGENPTAWLEALRVLVSNRTLCEEIKKAAKDYALARYNIEKVALSHLELFKQIQHS